MGQNGFKEKGYDVYALFDETEKKRYFADIVRKGYNDKKIDAYIIMINPGSCNKDCDYMSAEEYCGFPIWGQVCKAKSDPAQKCVMKLMDKCNLNKVRILNLLNLVEPKLDNIIEVIKSNEKEKFLRESIFSVEASEDEKALLPDGSIPCIISWGVDPALDELKQQAMDRLKERNVPIIGAKPKINPLSYLYIKPHTPQAQEAVIAELAALANNMIGMNTKADS